MKKQWYIFSFSVHFGGQVPVTTDLEASFWHSPDTCPPAEWYWKPTSQKSRYVQFGAKPRDNPFAVLRALGFLFSESQQGLASYHTWAALRWFLAVQPRDPITTYSHSLVPLSSSPGYESQGSQLSHLSRLCLRENQTKNSLQLAMRLNQKQ